MFFYCVHFFCIKYSMKKIYFYIPPLPNTERNMYKSQIVDGESEDYGDNRRRSTANIRLLLDMHQSFLFLGTCNDTLGCNVQLCEDNIFIFVKACNDTSVQVCSKCRGVMFNFVKILFLFL